MKRSKAICTGFVTVALAVALVACGNSGDTSRVSKAQFLSLANEICTRGTHEIEATANEQFTGGQKEAGERQEEQFALRVIVPSLQKQVIAIKKLGAPEGDEATIKIIVAEIQAAILEVEHNPASFIRGGEEAFAKANKFAAAYGLTACAAQ